MLLTDCLLFLADIFYWLHQETFNWLLESMTIVSSVFHTEVTVSIGLKNVLKVGTSIVIMGIVKKGWKIRRVLFAWSIFNRW